MIMWELPISAVRWERRWKSLLIINLIGSKVLLNKGLTAILSFITAVFSIMMIFMRKSVGLSSRSAWLDGWSLLTSFLEDLDQLLIRHIVWMEHCKLPRKEVLESSLLFLWNQKDLWIMILNMCRMFSNHFTGISRSLDILMALFLCYGVIIRKW